MASSNVAHAINNMSKELQEFLKPFYSSNEVVTLDVILNIINIIIFFVSMFRNFLDNLMQNIN